MKLAWPYMYDSRSGFHRNYIECCKFKYMCMSLYSYLFYLFRTRKYNIAAGYKMMSTILLADASESISSIKSVIIPGCIKSYSVTTALFPESIRLKLKLFDTGDRLPDFANVAHTLIKSLSDSFALSIKPLSLVQFQQVEKISQKTTAATLNW